MYIERKTKIKSVRVANSIGRRIRSVCTRRKKDITKRIGSTLGKRLNYGERITQTKSKHIMMHTEKRIETSYARKNRNIIKRIK